MATAAANGHNCGTQAQAGTGIRIVMSGESFTFPLFDTATGTLMLPWWSAAVIVAVVVVLVLLAMMRGGAIIITGGVAAIAFLALVVATVWVGTERAAQRERAEERHALLTRAQDLAAKAATPGSALGCLDAAAGEVVETACERAVFASPESIAAAAAYTAARIALLSDGIDYSVRANTSYEGVMPGLRRALEFDRFGFVAQVLVTHYGCTQDHCDAFSLFRDTTRLSINLTERAFDKSVERHASSWRPGSGSGSGSGAGAGASRPPVVSSSGASPVPPGFEVPSSASIPPVNIMVPESTSAAPSNGAAPSEAASAAAPAQPRRPVRAARPATPPANPGTPVQLVPPPSAPPSGGNTGAAPRPQ